MMTGREGRIIIKTVYQMRPNKTVDIVAEDIIEYSKMLYRGFENV